MFSRQQRLVFLTLALVAGLALGYARVKMTPVIMQDAGSHAATQNATQPLAGITLGGPFTLTDQDGRTVTEKSWPDRYLLVYFGFTHCPDICPLGLGRMTDALNALPADIADKIQPVFITVDPARDTAAELKNYVGLFHKKLVGLTGSPAQIDAVIKAYRVYAQKQVIDGDEKNYMMNHSSYTYLVSPANGRQEGAVIDVYAHDTTPTDMAARMSATVQAGGK